MPFDLGHHPTRYRPAPSLVGEARIGSAHIIGRAADWPFEQISDPLLQDAVCRQTYGIFDPFGFEKLVDLGIGKAGVGSEINERDLAAIARPDRLQNLIPAICAVDVAGTKRAPFEVDELLRAEVERRLTVGGASGADDVGAGLSCELRPESANVLAGVVRILRTSSGPTFDADHTAIDTAHPQVVGRSDQASVGRMTAIC